MSNGANAWGVSYSRIVWLQDAIKQHDNVVAISRHDDIIIEIRRREGCPITLICLDDYVLGESGVMRVLKEFPGVNFISVGGNWNGYTPEAKQICISRNIGLFNSGELTGALYKDEFWRYHKKDGDGNPSYPYKNQKHS